ncbi:unnamed protein product [Pleuronectes platessa]|uniref:Uncharacterized protein n=1 Tax=Pleuronectes platessa TaxID=8262 RepID=A0A9N7YU17_PLEPL|nr:unnamed protein product [Pleuronectes platessa]
MVQREHLQKEKKDLLAAVEDLQHRENHLQYQNQWVEIWLREAQAEIQTLYDDTVTLREKDKLLKEENRSLDEKVAFLRALNKESHDRIHEKHQRAEEAQLLIRNKDKLIEELRRRIAYEEVKNQSYRSITEGQNQAVKDLKEQLETRQENKVLGDQNQVTGC